MATVRRGAEKGPMPPPPCPNLFPADCMRIRLKQITGRQLILCGFLEKIAIVDFKIIIVSFH